MKFKLYYFLINLYISLKFFRLVDISIMKYKFKIIINLIYIVVIKEEK